VSEPLPHGYCYSSSYRHGDSDRYIHAYAHAGGITDANTYCYCHGDSHRHSYCDAHSYSNCNSNSDADTLPHTRGPEGTERNQRDFQQLYRELEQRKRCER
jgi:hypothetical protein